MFFHPYPIPENEPRRGIILLVVITMLTLFSVVAVGFVFYSQSESQASRLFKETEQPFRPDLEPELAMSYFMGQLLYGVENDEVGVQSVLRGHSLARNMFGYNPNQPNVIPFSGTGQVSNPKILNYLYFESDNMVRDPGYSGTRADPNAALGTYIGGLNPSYTYPDENNMFVAAVNTKGEVLKPSLIHEEHFDTNDGEWTNNSGKTRILRPRPTDHNGFPQINLGGDVKNLVGGLGIPNPNGGYYNYDSVWLDLGHPVLTGPNGIRYKPLFAPLIMCLDSKIDLNIHGNYRNGTHTSNQGIGVHAVNISRVLSQNNEWQNIFAGGRYGSNNQPNGSLLNYSKFVRTGYKNPPFYSSIDFDGDGSSNYKLPSEPGSYGNHVPFAKFGGNYNNGNGTEQTNHPLRFRYFSPQSDDRLFGLYNMEAILRYRDTGSPFLTSELFQLCPQNFQNSRVRWSVTTLSSDVNMPSAAPWLRSASTNYTLANNADHPTGTAQNLTTSNPRAGEFGAGLNSIVAGLGRLDLNRNLTPYPDVDNDGRMDVSDARTAHEERQEMAGEIFARLVLLTTGVRSEADWPSKNTNPQIYNAFRYLAQLSVNIVDFRDEDHISTVFHWDPNDNDRKDVVYGVELPRVVLSEVYSEVANHPTDQNSNQNAQMPLNVNFWIELLNPLREDNSLIEGGDALLVSNN